MTPVVSFIRKYWDAGAKLFLSTRTRTEGHVVDGPIVAADLLHRPVSAGVPDGDDTVFTAGHQQPPAWIQSNRVHLDTGKST